MGDRGVGAWTVMEDWKELGVYKGIGLGSLGRVVNKGGGLGNLGTVVNKGGGLGAIERMRVGGDGRGRVGERATESAPASGVV